VTSDTALFEPVEEVVKGPIRSVCFGQFPSPHVFAANKVKLGLVARLGRYAKIFPEYIVDSILRWWRPIGALLGMLLGKQNHCAGLLGFWTHVHNGCVGIGVVRVNYQIFPGVI
jgi:hypothetical protein